MHYLCSQLTKEVIDMNRRILSILVIILLLVSNINALAASPSSTVWFDGNPYVPSTHEDFKPFFKSNGYYTDSFAVNEKVNQLRTSDTHRGIDMGCPLDTPIYATFEGTITEVSGSGDAKFIVIRHDYDPSTYVTRYIYSVYMHMNDIDVDEGDSVYTGQQIGTSGPPGTTYGKHLHFGIATTSSSNYESMDYVYIHPFFEDDSYYNGGDDFDFLYDYTKNSSTNIVTIYGYCIPDTNIAGTVPNRFALSYVRLYHREVGDTIWEYETMTQSGYRHYYDLDNLSYSSGTSIQYFFRGYIDDSDYTPRKSSNDYDRWSYYPAKYKVPPENPNSYLWSYRYQTHTY